MYAIVKTGGKQYRVEKGQTLLVERLPEQEGESVGLHPILYRSEEAVFDKAGLQKVKVTAKILGHERGEKLRVFKFKPKRGYKRRTGHRQELTRIEVTDISAGAAKQATAKAKPAAKSEAKPAAKSQAKPAAKSEAKPAAKSQAKPAAKSEAKPAAKSQTKPAAGESEAAASKKEASDGS
jgi:large subunit ribosomal protein L21